MEVEWGPSYEDDKQCNATCLVHLSKRFGSSTKHPWFPKVEQWRCFLRMKIVHYWH